AGRIPDQAGGDTPLVFGANGMTATPNLLDLKISHRIRPLIPPTVLAVSIVIESRKRLPPKWQAPDGPDLATQSSGRKKAPEQHRDHEGSSENRHRVPTATASSCVLVAEFRGQLKWRLASPRRSRKPAPMCRGFRLRPIPGCYYYYLLPY